MAFARWDPINDLLAIHQRLQRFSPGGSGWTPPVDLYETADAYIVMVELLGLGSEDLRIDFHEGRLTLSGGGGAARLFSVRSVSSVSRGLPRSRQPL